MRSVVFTRKLSCVTAAAAALLLVPPATSAQSLRSAGYARALKEGYDHIYRLEYDEAIRSFIELGARYPEHPGPWLGRAATIWLRELFVRQEFDLDKFISPGYFTRPSERQMAESDRQAFFDDVAMARELAERYLERHPGDKDARYYLGAVESTLGVFAFTIERSYMSALGHGKRAYQLQKAIVEEDPEFYDSYLTVGTYEYILGNLPWYIKWLAALVGYRGSEQRGFEYLVLAADKGLLVADDARVLLLVLYAREGEYRYALEVTELLRKKYPENFLFHLNQAQILERMGETGRAVETYTEVVRLAEEGRRNYQKLPLATFRYTVGNRFLELGYRDEALAQFERATRDPATPPRELALSYLKAGQVLDLLGRREEAIQRYREVQRLREFEGSHGIAAEHLKTPYRESRSS